ncbi:MAG: hypothetical protein KJP02_02310 [Octadecabacter sp.]|nr:hypothetical protein [Octadecabacter sp.]
MAGKVSYITVRSGRYFARLVVPNNLRGVVRKMELRTPLGGDYGQALKRLDEATVGR